MPETLARQPQRARPKRDDPAEASSVHHRLPTWIKGVAPLALLAGLVILVLRIGPVGVFRASFPPVEDLTIERVTFPRAGEMRVHVVNGGPEPVTIAQILVDDAAWMHTVEGDRTLARLESRDIAIPYPWVEGEPHTVRIVTSTGLTFDHVVNVATLTPRPDARYLGSFALLGIYVGVIPVFLGLLWLPFIRSIARVWVDFFLALTVGLLIFLGVDALLEALETATRVASAFQGTALVLIGLIATPLAIHSIAQLRGRARATSPLALAALVALAIGLHNLGEGLAIGAAYAGGAIALGTTLVVGFLIHNTTEGLGIVAPLAEEKPGLRPLVALGTVAGVPTVLGAWIGGFTYSPLWTTLFLAVGAGAVAQVVMLLVPRLMREGRRVAPLTAAGLVAGLLVMYATGLLVAA
jgi:zinc transporter ZupT